LRRTGHVQEEKSDGAGCESAKERIWRREGLKVPEGQKPRRRLWLNDGSCVRLRPDNGPEFVARELRKWLASLGTGTLYIEPGSPWENGCNESFNG
jgi:transposase InsO family protein